MKPSWVPFFSNVHTYAAPSTPSAWQPWGKNVGAAVLVGSHEVSVTGTHLQLDSITSTAATWLATSATAVTTTSFLANCIS